ncbi:hypothetical protein OKJ48_40020 [Streptomyces kunmingensis]|uniref:Uncharacterized protein n=1 Tax=Streptomyces kunmingensis TaxID=68225 RepID=A0ABU6CNZ2_9ACTN|nr:hypothetical protein [Streptomyces kunmingensis]MEB3966372.1 hypothetical protein [Streptomyces kunmingensis]
MIRAGRLGFVQNSADLAVAMGFTSVKSFRNRKPYEADGFPAPISAPEAKGKLWDGEQTAAFLAGAPVPALSDVDDEEDLLERTEAAAFLDVAPKTWDSYKRDPRIAPHLVTVAGVEHCPRGVLRAYREQPSSAAGEVGHRPKGSGDMVPRDQLHARVGELLDADPALTLARLTEELGIANSTATRVLPRLRGERIADLCAAHEDLTPEQAAEELGYPAAVRKAAIAYAGTVLRGRRLRGYVQGIADALVIEGLAEEQDVAMVQVTADVVAAALILSTSAPVPALVWDERWGWRTATSRRHPLGRETGMPPEGRGTRYLCGSLQPSAKDVCESLCDSRQGSHQPPQLSARASSVAR